MEDNEPLRSMRRRVRLWRIKEFGSPTGQRQLREIRLYICTFRPARRNSSTRRLRKSTNSLRWTWGSLTEDKTNQQRTRVRISYHLVFYSLTNLLSSEMAGRNKLNVGLESLTQLQRSSKSCWSFRHVREVIQQDTSTRVQIRVWGLVSVEQETGRESDEPMHIHITYVSLQFPETLSD